MISEVTKKKNEMLFFKRLNQLGIDTECMSKELGEKILNATFTLSNEYGQAYDGSFLEIVLKKLTPYAVKINELLPESVRVDKDSLVKVCLLHQVAKAVKIVPNDNIWEMEKRGLLYKYDKSQPSIKTGLHSLVLCQNCGVTFTPQEAEAMTINDREPTDEQAKWFSSVMATIVKQANELTYATIKN